MADRRGQWVTSQMGVIGTNAVSIETLFQRRFVFVLFPSPGVMAGQAEGLNAPPCQHRQRS